MKKIILGANLCAGTFVMVLLIFLYFVPFSPKNGTDMVSSLLHNKWSTSGIIFITTIVVIGLISILISYLTRNEEIKDSFLDMFNEE